MNNKIKLKSLRTKTHNMFIDSKTNTKNQIKVKVHKEIIKRITDGILSVITSQILDINSSIYKNR